MGHALQQQAYLQEAASVPMVALKLLKGRIWEIFLLFLLFLLVAFPLFHFLLRILIHNPFFPS